MAYPGYERFLLQLGFDDFQAVLCGLAAAGHPKVEMPRIRGDHLHGFCSFAQECRNIQIGLLEIGDHGVTHGVEARWFR